MKIGVSLRVNYLNNKIETEKDQQMFKNFGSAEECLDFLKEKGLEAVEMKTGSGTPPDDIVNAAKKVWNFDLDLTLHTWNIFQLDINNFSVIDNYTELRDLYPNYGLFIDLLKQRNKKCILTIHGCGNKKYKEIEKIKYTTQIISKVRDLIIENELPLELALELNKIKDRYPVKLNSYSGLTEIIENCNNEKLNICWDFGHTEHNINVEVIDKKPSPDFLEKVIHTHIHTIGPTGSTHWPLNYGSDLWQDFIDMLIKKNYKGILNLELDPSRFHSKVDIKKAYVASVNRLKNFIIKSARK